MGAECQLPFSYGSLPSPSFSFTVTLGQGEPAPHPGLDEVMVGRRCCQYSSLCSREFLRFVFLAWAPEGLPGDSGFDLGHHRWVTGPLRPHLAPSLLVTLLPRIVAPSSLRPVWWPLPVEAWLSPRRPGRTSPGAGQPLAPPESSSFVPFF